MLDRGVNAGRKRLRVLGGDSVGADELDLLVEAILFGDDQGEVRLGLLNALLAFAQDFQTFQTGAEIALLGVQCSAVAFGLKGFDFGIKAGSLSLGVLHEGRHVLAALGVQEALQRFLYSQQAQISPHQLVELAQARVSAGVGRSQQVVRAGSLDVLAHGRQTAIAFAAHGRK